MKKQILWFRLGSNHVLPRDSLGGKPNPTGMTYGVSKDRHLTLMRLDLSNSVSAVMEYLPPGTRCFLMLGLVTESGRKSRNRTIKLAQANIIG
jgi:hypothetical protein